MGESLHCYTWSGRGKILEHWGKAEPKWHCGVMVKAVNLCWPLYLTSILDVYKVFEHLHMLRLDVWVHPYTVIPEQVGAKFWKTGVRWSSGAQMMLWCHDWGCKPLLTASHIHIGCIYNDWAPSYAVDRHMGAPLHCYTCAGGGQILKSWGKVEPKWCCGVMIEAVNLCCLHPTSILDLYKVFEHHHMLWIGIWVNLYTVIPDKMGANCLGNWGKAEPKWRCGVRVEAVNHHWLHPTSILDVYKMIEHLHILRLGIWVYPYTVIPLQVGAKFWKTGVRWSRNDVVVSWLRL